MAYKVILGKRQGFSSSWYDDTQSHLLDNPSNLRKENEDCRAQISFLTDTNNCLRLKISDLQKRIERPPLTDWHSDTFEVTKLKKQLKQLEQERKTLQDKNKEL